MFFSGHAVHFVVFVMLWPSQMCKVFLLNFCLPPSQQDSGHLKHGRLSTGLVFLGS